MGHHASRKSVQIGSNGSQREPVRVEYEVWCAQLRDPGLEVPAGGRTVAARCAFLKGGYAPVGYLFPPIGTGVGYPPQIVQMYNARRIAKLAGAEGIDNFKMGDELFNSVVFSAHQQKKFTDVILSQARTATQYFERRA